MKLAALVSGALLLASASAHAQMAIYDSQGGFHGYVNSNQFDPNSISNPYGRYGSPYSPESVNNPYGRWGSPYSPDSANNPYAIGSGAIEEEGR